MFFIDKYVLNYSKNSKNFIFNQENINKIKILSQDDRMPHMIFYGPEGSGRKTLINLLLELTFDKTIHNMSDRVYNITSNSGSNNSITVQQSNYHTVIEPNNNNFDKYMIDIIKEYSKSMPLNIFKTNKPFRIVVINNIDHMSYYAQTSLRRTMEVYSDTCRFVMWCESLSKVIEPLKSRSYLFKVAAPSDESIFENLLNISFQENLNLKLQDYIKIVNLSNNNIKKSLWLLQLKALNMSYYTNYDKCIKHIVKKICHQDIADILNIRALLYTITVSNITGVQILKDVLRNLLLKSRFNFDIKRDFIEIAARCEYNLTKGRREIIHIEKFIINVINVISQKYKEKIKIKVKEKIKT